jgi:nicotinate-nucleotide adenylyltransferase
MRTAIFGGTFDPIHSAHLVVAHEAAEAFALDRVLFIPAANPPHKAAGAPYEDRFRMVELACAADPRFLPSRLEEGHAVSYSIHTIERLRAPGARTGPSDSVVRTSSQEAGTGPSGSVVRASS